MLPPDLVLVSTPAVRRAAAWSVMCIGLSLLAAATWTRRLAGLSSYAIPQWLLRNGCKRRFIRKLYNITTQEMDSSDQVADDGTLALSIIPHAQTGIYISEGTTPR